MVHSYFIYQIIEVTLAFYLQAFHVFHTSCVIHWILFCEYEIIKNRFVRPNDSQPKPVFISNCGIPDKEIKQVLCPECQGTGVTIGGVLERPKFSLSQVCSLNEKYFLILHLI